MDAAKTRAGSGDWVSFCVTWRLKAHDVGTRSLDDMRPVLGSNSCFVCQDGIAASLGPRLAAVMQARTWPRACKRHPRLSCSSRYCQRLGCGI